MVAVRTIKRLLREPLVQFLGAAGLLFLAHALWGRAATEVIEISPEALAGLETAREELLLRPITDEEREELISNFVDEEILLREAYRGGLDRSDPRIRRWLIDKMQFVLDEEPPEPTRAQLEARFREKRERYLTPLAVSFDHVFYANGTELPESSDEILGRLRAGAEFTKLGDEFWLGPTLNRFSHPELSGTLGKAFADQVVGLPPGEWSGPIASSRGVHFVRLAEKHEPELPLLDDVLWAVREDFLRQEREESLERKLAELRARYRISLPDR